MSCNDNLPCNECTDCSACGHCLEACTCTTPGYDNTGCIETQSSDCVTFNGGNLPCIPIQTGNTITVAIQRIVTYLKNLWNHVNSDSLVITPSAGTCNGDLNIEIVPSTDLGNIFTLGSDGFPFVPNVPNPPIGALKDVDIINGSCITWTKTTVADVITFTPTIDWNCVASHTCPVCSGTLCPNPLNLTVN